MRTYAYIPYPMCVNEEFAAFKNPRDSYENEVEVFPFLCERWLVSNETK